MKTSHFRFGTLAAVVLSVSGISVVSAQMRPVPGDGPSVDGRQAMEERRAEMKDDLDSRMAERKDVMEERQGAMTEARCENILRAGDTLVTRLTDREDAFKKSRETWTDRWQEHVTEADDTLASRRNDDDMRREEMYANMLDRATTDEQKAAIKTFQDAVEAAVEERRATVDQAIADFRSAASQLRDGSKTSHDGAVAAFQTAVQAAVQQAKAACGDGTDPQTVREQLRTSLKSAHENLSGSLKSDDTLGQRIKALVDARQATVTAAMETFRQKLEAAREALKAALQPTE